MNKITNKTSILAEKIYDSLEAYLKEYCENTSVFQLFTPFFGYTSPIETTLYDAYTPNEFMTLYRIMTRCKDDKLNYFTILLKALSKTKSGINRRVGRERKYRNAFIEDFEEVLNNENLLVKFSLEGVFYSCTDTNLQHIDMSNYPTSFVEMFRRLSEVFNRIFDEMTLEKILGYQNLGDFKDKTPNEFLSMYCSEDIHFDLESFINYCDTIKERGRIGNGKK